MRLARLLPSAPPLRAELRAALRRRLMVGAGPFELGARAWAVSGVVGR
jgi:hypothetical protein